MGLCRRSLGRYRRDSANDLVTLPALFVDVDDSSSSALKRLQDMRPVPIWIIFMGGVAITLISYWMNHSPICALPDINYADSLN